MQALIQIGRVVIQNPVVREAAKKLVVSAAGAAGVVIGKKIAEKLVDDLI